MPPLSMESSWYERLGSEFEKAYMAQLRSFLKKRKEAGVHIYPRAKDVFRAFAMPYDAVQVVILGQDPYHGIVNIHGHACPQADGLAFSVPSGAPLPPSLLNIQKELREDLGQELQEPIPGDPVLAPWERQGVLLLNAVLTVEAHRPASHRGMGWERWTDRVLEILNTERAHLIFILWGRQAGQKRSMIDTARHRVLMSSHPSPLSARHGFFGSRPFSRTNAYLQEHDKPPILWGVPLQDDNEKSTVQKNPQAL